MEFANIKEQLIREQQQHKLKKKIPNVDETEKWYGRHLTMASNFKVLKQKRKGNLHLKLSGAFDGSSACELVNILNDHEKDVMKIFINTSSLSAINSFGINTFRTRYARQENVMFMGKFGRYLGSKDN